MRKTFEQELERCRVLVYGVQTNPEIKERIAPVYPEARITEGLELYEAAKGAAEIQNTEKMESMAATKVFTDSRDAIHQSLIRTRQAIRYFFKNDFRILKLMQMDQEIPASYASWKILAETTFRTALANAEVLEKLTVAGITEESINQTLALLAQLEQQRLTAEKEDGEAQQATMKKQEAFDKLTAYCSDLRECLNLFFVGRDRQKLEEVGIIVK